MQMMPSRGSIDRAVRTAPATATCSIAGLAIGIGLGRAAAVVIDLREMLARLASGSRGSVGSCGCT